MLHNCPLLKLFYDLYSSHIFMHLFILLNTGTSLVIISHKCSLYNFLLIKIWWWQLGHDAYNSMNESGGAGGAGPGFSGFPGFEELFRNSDVRN